jgi:ABC-2 type transport system permease protein
LADQPTHPTVLHGYAQIVDVISIYLRLIRVQIRAQLQYPLSFLSDITFQLITTLIMFTGIALVIQRFNNIGGWRVPEVAFLWGMIDINFGLMDLVFSGFDDARFTTYVRQGLFDQLLLRPVSITLQVFGSQFTVRRLGRILEGCVVLAYALSTLHLHWTLVKLLYLPFIGLSQFMFFGGLFITGATITFWTIQPVEAMNIFTYGGSEMMSYPMNIYPNLMRHFFTFILPAIFLNYYPALFLLDKPDPLGFPLFAPFLAPLAGAGVLGAALLFWQLGLRHYQGTGS